MLQRIQSLGNLLRKPLLFGFCGGLGCFIAAMCLGEVFLHFTKLPPSPVKAGQAVVLLIDTSGSMAGNKLEEVKAAATNFIERQDLKKNALAIASFNSGSQVVNPLGSDQEALVNGISNLNADGGTNIPSGINTAIQELQSGNSQNKSNILLFTDGVPNSEPDTISAANLARQQGINLIAVATGDANTGFLSQVTGDSSLVFFVNSGEFDKAFRQAEKIIYGKQLVESGETGDYGLVYGLLRISGWTGLLAIGVSLALISGQNLYMRRRVLSLKEFAVGTLAGLLAGGLAGAIGQLVFLPIATLPIGEILGRVTGWGILGTCLGGSMSFFMPNLNLKRALLGGLLGGVIGAVGFVVFAGILGDIAGRLIGGAILGFFIGIMIALLEVLSQQPQLVVYWSTSEQTKIAIGKTPIVIGSSSEAHVHLSRGKGFPPVVAKIKQDEGRIVMEYSEAMRDQGMKILVFELKDREKRKFGDIMLEIRLKDN